MVPDLKKELRYVLGIQRGHKRDCQGARTCLCTAATSPHPLPQPYPAWPQHSSALAASFTHVGALRRGEGRRWGAKRTDSNLGTTSSCPTSASLWAKKIQWLHWPCHTLPTSGVTHAARYHHTCNRGTESGD